LIEYFRYGFLFFIKDTLSHYHLWRELQNILCKFVVQHNFTKLIIQFFFCMIVGIEAPNLCRDVALHHIAWLIYATIIFVIKNFKQNLRMFFCLTLSSRLYVESIRLYLISISKFLYDVQKNLFTARVKEIFHNN
jgi:hypothetical protein